MFLERGGQTVTTRDGDEVAIPRFGGGDRAWTALVACVKDRFAPFQVDITDRRPARGPFITALVGGRASMVGLDDSTTNGIGPYDGTVLRTATVHIFSQVGTGERDVENLCAVTAHEVGHSLGLDHEYQCGDIMSYFNDECGTQAFLDVDAPCGEDSERGCSNGDETQNSYQRLAQLVGLRSDAAAAGPQPAVQAPAAEEDDDDEEYDASDDVFDEASSDGDEPPDEAPEVEEPPQHSCVAGR